jgi:hypothetical protein
MPGHRRYGDDQIEMDPESRRCFEGAVVAFLCGLLAAGLVVGLIVYAIGR